MKISKIPVARTGIFVTICFALLVIALFAIGDKEKLFSSSSYYYVKIKDISGLKTGAQVTMSGISIGSVKRIDLPIQTGDSVIIEMTIIEDAQKLIRKDSKAQIVTEGLVGNKGILITSGTANAVTVHKGDTLIGESPFDLSGVVNNVTSTITDAGTLLKETTELIKVLRTGDGTVSKLMNDPELYKSLTTLIEAITKSTNSINNAASGALGSVRLLTDSLQRTISDLNIVTSQIRSGKGSIGKLLNDEELYNKLTSLGTSIQGTIAELNETMHKLNLAAGNGVEVTEALKHNFLVSDYFEDRGYWSTTDFERDIRLKIDSLNRLKQEIDRKQK
jgi:phospholipid/cholesterol/gamma-HCH transport system substrate-binding protein